MTNIETCYLATFRPVNPRVADAIEDRAVDFRGFYGSNTIEVFVTDASFAGVAPQVDVAVRARGFWSAEIADSLLRAFPSLEISPDPSLAF